MKKGINYDVGILPGEDNSRKVFDPGTVAREMRLIATELHCDTVRISGADPARITVAAEHAAAEGMEVWFAPFPVDLTEDEALAVFTDSAGRAEALRRSGAEVVLVTGCELTAFCQGFIEGAGYRDRLQAMVTGDVAWWTTLLQVMPRFSGYMERVAESVRPLFGGRLSYASGPWEPIDWAPYDIVGVDAYRAAHNAHDFADELRAQFKHGKPVAVTEFGTCAYRGAGERGGVAWAVPDGAVRDEDEQVRYFTELMDVFEREAVETALWFTFAAYNRTGPADLGSYGVIKLDDDGAWSPKKVFGTMAARYSRS